MPLVEKYKEIKVTGILPEETKIGNLYRIIKHQNEKEYFGTLVYRTEFGLVWMKNGYGWDKECISKFYKDGSFLLQEVANGTELIWNTPK